MTPYSCKCHNIVSVYFHQSCNLWCIIYPQSPSPNSHHNGPSWQLWSLKRPHGGDTVFARAHQCTNGSNTVFCGLQYIITDFGGKMGAAQKLPDLMNLFMCPFTESTCYYLLYSESSRMSLTFIMWCSHVGNTPFCDT